MDYKDIKKSIKQVEYDRMKYHVKIFFSILAGIILGIAWNWIAGFILFMVLGIKTQRTYWELGKK